MPYQTTPLSVYTRRYQPRHPLAQHAIRQIDSQKLRAQDIVSAMGYPTRHTIPACDRLRHVLSDRYLGLDNSYMDAHLSAEAFLAKLFAVLSLSYADFADDIARIHHDAAHHNKQSSKVGVLESTPVDFEAATWLVCREHTSA